MDEARIEEVEQRLIREVAGIVRKDPAEIGPETPLPELGIDSMGFVELLVMVEKNFGLRLSDSALDPGDFATVRAMARRVALASAE